MDIHEVVRWLREGVGDREIARLVGLNRRTVVKYRCWARQQGVLEGPLPTAGELEGLLAQTLPGVEPPQQVSSVERYRDEIVAYRERGLEVAAIRARLQERHGPPVSYSAVWRLVRRLEPKAPEAFVRVEVAPGSEAQVDFGYAGLVLDPVSGRPRKSWVFVLELSWSRHLYAEIVFDQTVATWLLCHRHAFEGFGGVPERVVPDNLKAAIVRASVHEPAAQRAYRECALHYGFRIDPTPPRSPWLKGKVEQGGVHYVARNFLAGREVERLDERNAKLRRWATDVAGQRVHGTTKRRPLERFAAVERAALGPLPPMPYDLAIWKQAAVYRDCHVVFAGSYYSAPHRLVGQRLWIRGGARTVELYGADHQLVATHDRARAPGERQTHLDHLPAHKVPGLVATRDSCRARATAVGPAASELVEHLLAHRPEDRLRVAQRVLALGRTAGEARLERACARALFYGTADYATVKRILAGGLETAPLGAGSAAPPPPRYAFVRQASEFVTSLWGGAR